MYNNVTVTEHTSVYLLYYTVRVLTMRLTACVVAECLKHSHSECSIMRGESEQRISLEIIQRFGFFYGSIFFKDSAMWVELKVK